MIEQIQTSRLTLLRLDREWMERFSQNAGQAAMDLEDAFSLSHCQRTEHPTAAYRGTYEELIRFPGEEKWLCFWEIIEREAERRIGGMLFKGPPDENGAVEIGYGIDGDFRRKGYGLEAVREGIAWAFAQGAGEVIAKINPGNLASQRLLERVGMTRYRMIGKMPCYHIMRGPDRTVNPEK